MKGTCGREHRVQQQEKGTENMEKRKGGEMVTGTAHESLGALGTVKKEAMEEGLHACTRKIIKMTISNNTLIRET